MQVFAYEEARSDLIGKRIMVTWKWLHYYQPFAHEVFGTSDAAKAKQTTGFLTDPVILPLFNTTERKEDVLEVANSATKMFLWEAAKRTMKLLNDLINLVCFLYHADFWNLRGLQEASAGQELAKSAVVLLFVSSYYVTFPRKLENTNHNVFKTNSMEGFCDLVRKPIMTGGQGRVFSFAPQFSMWWRVVRSWTNTKGVLNDGEGYFQWWIRRLWKM